MRVVLHRPVYNTLIFFSSKFCTFTSSGTVQSEKSSSIHGDYGDFRVGLFKRSRRQICQNYFSVLGEYAERILTYAENMPRLFCRTSADRIKTEIEFSAKTNTNNNLNHLSIHDRMGTKTISRCCPFKVVCHEIMGVLVLDRGDRPSIAFKSMYFCFRQVKQN